MSSSQKGSGVRCPHCGSARTRIRYEKAVDNTDRRRHICLIAAAGGGAAG